MRWKRVLCGLLTACMVAGTFLPQCVSAETTKQSVITPDETVPENGKQRVLDIMELESVGDSAVVPVTTQEELKAALEAASKDEAAPTVIELENDIELTASITVAQNTYVKLVSAAGNTFCLKYTGANLADSTAATAGVLIVNGTLRIENVVIDADHKGRVCRIGMVAKQYAGVLTLGNGAVIQNGGGSTDGMGVYMSGPGVKDAPVPGFYMEEGSKVCGCQSFGKSAVKGIGVYVANWSWFEMSGGEICDNVELAEGRTGTNCASGGGVYINAGTASYPSRISGGSISRNTVYGEGGGIYIISSTRTVELSGKAKISGNSARVPSNSSSYYKGRGGGIYVSTGTLTISDGVEISSNTASTSFATVTGALGNAPLASGGGIYLASTGKVIQYGGMITGNTAECTYETSTGDDSSFFLANGGGVCVEKGTYTMNGGSITGNSVTSTLTQNTKSGNGGGVYVGFTPNSTGAGAGGQFLCNGGTITGNTAQSHGSGVYIENAGKVQKSGMGSTVGDIVDTYASPDFQVSGNVVISQNGIGGNQENLYLPKTVVDANGKEYPALFTVSGGLGSNASVSLSVEAAQDRLIVAKGTDSYYIEETDLNKITFINKASQEKQYSLALNETNQIELEEKNERATLVGSTITFLSGKTESAAYTAAYDGEAKQPSVVVRSGGKLLVSGRDYTTAYYQNINAGTARVTVFGKGVYKGSMSKSFTITPHVVTDTDADFVVSKVPDKYQSGEQIQPKVTVSYKGNELKENTDYTVSYGENISGTGTVTVTGVQGSNFTGKKTISFAILDIGDVRTVSTEAELKQAFAESVSNIILANDINLAMKNASGVLEATTLAEGDDIHLYGNGYTLKMATTFAPVANFPTRAIFVLPDGNSKLTVSDITIDGASNTTTARGRLFYVGVGANLVLENTVILQNAKSSGSDIEAAKGSFIYNAGTTEIKGATLQTQASGYRGSVYNAEKATLTISDGAKFINLKTSFGGALLNDGNCVLKDGTFTSCNGITDYGAITNMTGAVFEMNGGKITASNGGIPAVYNAGQFTMKAGEITGNTNTYITYTHSSGGAVRNIGTDAVFTMQGGSISKNKTYGAGGGIFVDSGTVIIDGENALISDNQAYRAITSGSNNTAGYANGGGVFVKNGTVTLKNGKICNNLAGFSVPSDQPSLLPQSSKTTYMGNGGGIFVYGGTFTMEGGTISGNQAQGQTDDVSLHCGLGGAAYVSGGGTFCMKGGSIGGEIKGAANQSDVENAGGIYVADKDTAGKVSDGVFQLGGGKITDTIYMNADQRITLVPEQAWPSDALYHLYMNTETLSIGSTLAEYAETVPDELIQPDDVYHFVVDNYPDLAIKVDVETRTLVTDKTKLSDCEILIPSQTYTYTGQEIKAPVTIKTKQGSNISSAVFCTYSAEKTNVGTVTVTLRGNGATVEGEATRTYTIVPASIAQASVTLSQTKFTYQGGTQYCPAVTVKWNGRTLVKDQDYSLSYSNNTSAGTATVTVIGKGNFKDSAARQFTIVKMPQQVAASSYTKKYGAAPFTLSVSRVPSDGGKLTYSSNKPSVAKVDANGKVTIMGAGTATITVTAAETDKYYSAKTTATITVTKAAQSISGKTVYSKTYGNKAFSLGMSVKDKANLSYKSANKKIVTVTSKGKVTIKGTGRTTITVTAAATNNYNKATKKITVTVKPKTMAKPKVTSPSKKTLLIKWSKDTKAKGYRIQVALNSKFTKSAKTYTVKSYKTTSKKIKGLKAGKTYYVRIQAYQLVSGKALTGSYSKTAKIKVKR